MHSIRMLAITSLALPVFASGCALVEATTAQSLYSGKLEPDRSITLRSYTVRNAFNASPRYTFTELQFVALKGDSPVASINFGRRPLSEEDKGRLLGYASTLTDLAGRTSAEHDRVWIVDRHANRVIVAYELPTGRVFPMDSPLPDWATADSGIPLETVPPLAFRTQSIYGIGFGDRN